MEDAPPCLAEEVVVALLTQLLRKGLIDEDDLEAMCAGLGEDAAHQIRCCFLEAAAPSQSEWEAERARARFRVVKGGEE